MGIKIYQPHRTDLLINTQWGVPKERLSKEDASHGKMKLFHGRWVTREEKRQLKDQYHAYRSVRVLAKCMILLVPFALFIMLPFLQGNYAMKGLLIVYGSVFIISGIGLLRYRRWARNIATPALISLLFLPFLSLLSLDKGAPVIGVFGIIGLYYLHRNTVRRIFNEQYRKDSKQLFLKNRRFWLLIFVSLVIVFAFWQVGEPGRRARAVYRAIHSGMSPNDVLALPKGRYLCSYRIETDGESKSCTREEFLKTLTSKSKGIIPRGIITVTFLGIAPGRFSFQVEFGHDGKVNRVTGPHGWD